MLKKSYTKSILSKFPNKTRTTTIVESFNSSIFSQSVNNKTDLAAVAFIDIYKFSLKVIDFNPIEVRDYLKEYYSTVFPIIGQYSGQIERITGDGIIIIFSKIFGDYKTDIEATDASFECSKEIIEKLYGTEFEAKSAISVGKLFFCKTGIENLYEECSCVGYPLTMAYRIESIAEKNQIIMPATLPLAKRILNNQPANWTNDTFSASLKGIKSHSFLRLQY